MLDRLRSLRAHRHAVRSRVGVLSEHGQAARPLAAPRRRAPRARARRRRADRARLRLRDARRRSAATTARPSASSRTSTRARTRPATGVDPQIWRDYDGGEIVLPATGARCSRRRRARSWPSESATTSSPRTGRRSSAPTTRPASPRSWPRASGSLAHPDVPRARARIGFTVDEEVGHGTDHFDLERFGADFAYTARRRGRRRDRERDLLGDRARGHLHRRRRPPGLRQGQAREPGQARGAVRREPAGATRSRRRRPRAARGSCTRTRSRATPAAVTVTLILRDHDGAKLEEHDALVRRLAEEAVAGEPRATVAFERWDQYRNMREALDARPARASRRRSRRHGASGSSRRSPRSAAAPTARG